MSKFVAIVFPNEEKIPEAVRTLRNMHGGKGIKLSDYPGAGPQLGERR